MSKDFYEEKEKEFADVNRSFTFAGVHFEIKAVMPGDAMADLAMIGDPNSGEHVYDILVSIVRRTLKPEYRPLWNDLLVQERDVPITLDVLTSLVRSLVQEENALVEERTGRPTQPPSPSGGSARNGETSSTVGSASKEARATTSSPSVPV